MRFDLRRVRAGRDVGKPQPAKQLVSDKNRIDKKMLTYMMRFD